MKEYGWIPISTKPPETGQYIIYAPSADPNKPLIMGIWWWADTQEWGIVQIWAEAITHWHRFPDPPEI